MQLHNQVFLNAIGLGPSINYFDSKWAIFDSFPPLVVFFTQTN